MYIDTITETANITLDSDNCENISVRIDGSDVTYFGYVEQDVDLSDVDVDADSLCEVYAGDVVSILSNNNITILELIEEDDYLKEEVKEEYGGAVFTDAKTLLDLGRDMGISHSDILRELAGRIDAEGVAASIYTELTKASKGAYRAYPVSVSEIAEGDIIVIPEDNFHGTTTSAGDRLKITSITPDRTVIVTEGSWQFVAADAVANGYIVKA